jgi:hypothetical protein
MRARRGLLTLWILGLIGLYCLGMAIVFGSVAVWTASFALAVVIWRAGLWYKQRRGNFH